MLSDPPAISASESAIWPPATPNASEAPIDAAVAEHPVAADRQPHQWSSATRIAFRFAFCYLGGYCIFNGNATVFSALPILGYRIQDVLARVFLLPAQYLAQHLFHVPPPGDHLHSTGSGDTAIAWIALLLLLIASAVATLAWSALDRRRPHYQTPRAWLRFLIRLTLGLGMVVYGLDKIFPLQMPPPSVSSLAEPFGMHSPMLVLWNFIGLNPAYEMLCGGAEFLAGAMLLFRRTALAGAIFSAFVVSNVLAFNLFFDVPVKIYSGHLLLLSLFIILPDAPALFRFFWKHEPAAPTGVWVPPTQRRWFRRATLIVETVFVVVVVGGTLLGSSLYWLRGRRDRVAIANCELCRAWRVELAAPVAGGAVLPDPFGQRVAELVINSPTSAAVQAEIDGQRQHEDIKLEEARHTLEMDGPARSRVVFQVTQVNPMYVTLTPTGAMAGKLATANLTSLTPEDGYPLTHRGFHWISEYPYQR